VVEITIEVRKCNKTISPFSFHEYCVESTKAYGEIKHHLDSKGVAIGNQ